MRSADESRRRGRAGRRWRDQGAVLTSLFAAVAILALSARAVLADPLGGAPTEAAGQPAKLRAPTEPSLAMTLDFIREKLNERGQMTYALQVHDSAHNSDFVNRIISTDKVVVDPGACRIADHTMSTVNGNAQPDSDSSQSLRAVTDVALMTLEDFFKRAPATVGPGHPSVSVQVSPPTWVIEVRTGAVAPLAYLFKDEDTAERVAKAFAHAAKLCGGLAAQPF